MFEIIALVMAIIAAGAVGMYFQSRAQNAAQDRLLIQRQYELESLQQRIDEFGTQLGAKDDVIDALKSGNMQKDEAITSFKATIAEKEATVETLTCDMKKLNEQIVSLQASVADRQYTQALLLTLSNSAYDALIIVDKDLRVIAINDPAEHLFDNGQALGNLLLDVTGLPELDMMVTDALRDEEGVFEEQLKINENFYRVRSSVTRRDGHYFIGLALQDITMLVRLNRARRDMVANISHELRHPIANIRLTIDSLFHEQDKPKRKESITSLRTIARETENLMWLVQEMSDLAMIESGQSIVRMVKVSLPELVDEAVERMEDQSDTKSIKIVRHVPARLQVLCDRDLAQRVLINLLHNAIKWSPDDETITIDVVGNKDDVTISVLDNGPGVPPEKVERIFERFYQVDDSRSRTEGTGLGLAICKHIVEAHGGRIWAESNEKGSGGRFLFTLLSAEDETEVIEEAEI